MPALPPEKQSQFPRDGIRGQGAGVSRTVCAADGTGCTNKANLRVPAGQMERCVVRTYGLGPFPGVWYKQTQFSERAGMGEGRPCRWHGAQACETKPMCDRISLERRKFMDSS